MNKEFVPYKESLELKELGFDEPTLYHWHESSKENPFTNGPRTNSGIKDIGDENHVWSAPTFSQSFRWFREKLAIRSCIIDNHQTPGYTYTTGPDQYYYDTGSENGWFHTYEEAELACLNKLIEIVKQK